MFVINFFLGMLAAMLLYSLMLSDVDSKTYEYGMLRALGFKKAHLMSMISMQSALFSVPGIMMGLIAAWIFNMMIRESIFIESYNMTNYSLTGSALLVGGLFGLIMPQIANYLPIKAAMGKNLRNSLDLNRRNKDAIGVTATKLEDVGMDINQMIVSVMLVVIGFTTYYLIPYSFYEQDTIMMFLLLNMLLLMIIVGLTFICVLLFRYLESLILWTTIHTCCRRDKRVY